MSSNPYTYAVHHNAPTWVTPSHLLGSLQTLSWSLFSSALASIFYRHTLGIPIGSVGGSLCVLCKLGIAHCLFLLKQCKYTFSGTCPIQSWKILLSSALDSFELLISLINLREGSEGSMCLNLAYLGELAHSPLHFAFHTALSTCNAADLLHSSVIGLWSLLGFYDLKNSKKPQKTTKNDWNWWHYNTLTPKSILAETEGRSEAKKLGKPQKTMETWKPVYCRSNYALGCAVWLVWNNVDRDLLSQITNDIKYEIRVTKCLISKG